MTKKELIERLETYPDDWEVQLWHEGDPENTVTDLCGVEQVHDEDTDENFIMLE